MQATDLTLDSDGDLAIMLGDFELSQSDSQHISDLLISMQGDWRQSPLIGVGLRHELNGTFDAKQISGIKKRILSQLKLDGYQVERCQISRDFTLDIQANRI